MYIFELLFKKFKGEKVSSAKTVASKYLDDVEDAEKCDHIFMPIDSTGKIFACSKCGQILKK